MLSLPLFFENHTLVSFRSIIFLRNILLYNPEYCRYSRESVCTAVVNIYPISTDYLKRNSDPYCTPFRPSVRFRVPIANAMENFKDFQGKGALIMQSILRLPLGIPRLPGCSQAFARYPFGAFAFLSPGPFLSSGVPSPVILMVLRFLDIFMF